MAHKAAISFLLNSLEQQPQQPQQAQQQASSEVVVLGDFTCEPGSSNAICIEQPQPQQPQQAQQTQLRPRSAFVPYVRPSASSMTNLANPKKRKAPPTTNLPLHNTANKQRRLETTPTTTVTTTMSLLREDVVAQISSIKERTVMQFTTPDTDVNTCRRNKLLALQLLKESASSFFPQQQQDSFVDRERATPQQVAFLDRIFVLDPFPSAATRSLIAEKLGMTPKRVQNWFQNKRARSSHNNDNNTHNNDNNVINNNNNNNDYNSDNDNPASEKRKGGKRKGGDSGDAFVFHHLALCPNGQLVLSSDGAPPLLLKPSLLRADRF